jgi:hypothetical protein
MFSGALRRVTLCRGAELVSKGNIVQMPTAVKIWEIVKDSLSPVTIDTFANNYLERQLETWVAADPSILGERLLIIAQQKSVPGVGRLDLLGIDQNGSLVIIELKRDHTPREAVAQALDYASSLDSVGEVVIEDWAQEYLKRPLKEKFCDYFDAEDMPELSCEKHRILLVAPRLDASAERIINYLSQRYDVQINAVFFQYARLSDGKEVLARALLVAEDTVAHSNRRPTGSKGQITVDELMKIANDRETTSLVAICREVGKWWFEEVVGTLDGSFRYWGESTAGHGRMVFGINVAAKANPPQGQLDVWIPAPSVAEITGRAENDVRAALEKHPVIDIRMGRNNPCWIRLKSEEEARGLVQQLREFIEPQRKVNLP